jgi:hypothetical protein
MIFKFLGLFKIALIWSMAPTESWLHSDVSSRETKIQEKKMSVSYSVFVIPSCANKLTMMSGSKAKSYDLIASYLCQVNGPPKNLIYTESFWDDTTPSYAHRSGDFLHI